MSANKYEKHLIVLPEDDANHSLANGFYRHHLIQNQNRLQIMPPARGWSATLESARKTYFKGMQSNTLRHLLLLIDFDNQQQRGDDFLAGVPQDLAGRVFVMGVLSEPEPLRADLRISFESIGARLCAECANAVTPR